MPVAQAPSSDVPGLAGSSVSRHDEQRSRFRFTIILRDSLYYPASSFDGDPVAYLAGCIASFIYVDFSRDQAELEAELEEPGFLGYRRIDSRLVTERELTPDGWRPENPTEDDRGRRILQNLVKPPFCTWSVFERCPEFPSAHGRPGSAFLPFADGRAAFQALYLSNGQRPKALAIIQPGDNVFEDPGGMFARNVLHNAAGAPEFYCTVEQEGRDFYLQAPWPGYSAPSCVQGVDGDRACSLREYSMGEFVECRTTVHREACFLGDTNISIWFRDS